MARDAGRPGVKSAERVLDLLEQIGTQPDGVSFSSLADRLHIPKSSLHALLKVLGEREYVVFQPERRAYSLGLRVWETGQAFQRQHDVLREAPSILAWIVGQVNETAQLAKLADSENVYLGKVESTHPLRLQSEVGRRLSAHATGIGKALLAELDDDEVIRRFSNVPMTAYTANTCASMADLLRELAEVRRRGFAIDNEEYTPGVFCLAVPVYSVAGGAEAAISVSVPTTRVTRQLLGRILSVLAEASLQLSERSGAGRRNRLLMALSQPNRAQQAIQEVTSSGRYVFSFSGDGNGALELPVA
jgi:DNA-binding IclR family transcriptional regulator